MTLNKRDRQRLKALRVADEALYELWKQCYIGEGLFNEVSKLQLEYIHPEIRKLTERKGGT